MRATAETSHGSARSSVSRLQRLPATFRHAGGGSRRPAVKRGEYAMEQPRIWRSLSGVVLVSLCLAWPAAGFAAGDPVKLEWFSWSIFRLTSPTGKIVLTNPFVTNPDSKVKVADFPKADVILVADGHPDEVGSTAEIALATGAKIVTS